MKKTQNQKKYRIKSKLIRRLLNVFLCFFIISCLLVTLVISGFGFPFGATLDPEKIVNLEQSVFFYDDQGNVIASRDGGENRVKINLSDVPLMVRQCFIAAEDARFYSHKGFDIIRIFGALFSDIKTGNYNQGGSTISQQLIKNSHLTTDKTLSRKVQELFLSIQLENRFSKDEILEMYLNFIYFGNGAYGIEAASRAYFGKTASKLTLEEGALLAGIIKAPSYYAPHLNMKASLERRNLILNLMAKYHYISIQTANEAKNIPIQLCVQEKPAELYGYFLDEVVTRASQLLHMNTEELVSGGLHIYTTMNASLQKFAEQLPNIPDITLPTAPDGTPSQCALVVLNRQGEVKSILGGRDYETTYGLNRATQSKRQPGSAIKPIIVYAPALEYQKLNPCSILQDKKTDFSGYTPENFDHKYRGLVTLRNAVANSLNVPAVHVFQKLGIENGKSYAKSVGIPFDNKDTNLSLALGGFTTGISPLQLAAAYAPFSNEGTYYTPTFITQIQDSDGRILYQCPHTCNKVLSQDTSYLMTDILKTTVTSGTAKQLQSAGIPLAAKTGTVGTTDNANNDAWIAAYNPEYVSVVWMGYDEPTKKRALPESLTGGTLPAKWMVRIFSFLYPNGHGPTFLQPSTIVQADIDQKVLLSQQRVMLSNAYTPNEYILHEVFRKKDVPTQTTDYWALPAPPSQIRVEINQRGFPMITFTTKQSHIQYIIYRKIGALPAFPLKKVQGAKNTAIQFIDQEPIPGFIHTYYVKALHPEMQKRGIPAEGKSSSTASTYVPLTMSTQS